MNGVFGATAKPAKILIDNARIREKAKKVTDNVVDKTTETGATLLKEGVNFVTQPTTIRVTGKVVGIRKTMTVKLKNALNKASSFAELAPIVLKAAEKVSFGGYRYVYAPGYKGKVHIDRLAKKTMALVKENFDFDEVERGYGKSAALKIDKLYADNKKRVKSKNFLTRMFSAIRECFNQDKYGHNTRFYWDLGNSFEHEFYEYYTANQYEKVFGKKMTEGGGGCWLQSHCPDRTRGPRLK